MPSAKKRKEMQRGARMRQVRLWSVVGAVVLVLAVLAVVLGSGEQPASNAVETAPVTASGDPLPLLASGADPAVGSSAPKLDGATFDGTPVTIDPGSTGKPTAIWFIAHWCPHCNAEVPRIVSLEEQGAIPDGLDVYAVSTGVDPSAPNYPPSSWFEAEGWPYPVLADEADGTAALAYGLPSYPFLVLTDADGNVVFRHAGELGEDGIMQVLQQLVGA